MRVVPVLGRCADVVVQASQSPGFEKGLFGGVVGDPGGKVLGYDRVAVAVDAETVVVSLFGEEGLNVGLGFLDYS